MPQYDTLQMLSFRLAPEHVSLMHRAWVLSVPEEWKQILSEMQRQVPRRAGSRESKWVTIPFKSLHKTLRALVPGLIAIEPGAWKAGPRPWLYAAAPISTEALFHIIRAWGQVEFDRVPSCAQMLRHLRVGDLEWREGTFDLAATSLCANGTSNPGDSTFHLLPDLLARKLSAAGIELEAGLEPLRFRRAPLPTAPRATMSPRGVELISWPPRITPMRLGEAPFSIVLTLTVQTVPYQGFPAVHCDISRRRWAYGRNIGIPPQEDTSVYLLTSVPWLRDLEQEQSPAFQVAPIKWKRLEEAERTGEAKYKAAWSSKEKLAAILERLQPHCSFPDAEAIRAEPSKYLNPHGDQSAAIMFRNGMEPVHEVGVGIGPGDRQKLGRQIADLLQPDVILTEPLKRAARVTWKTVKSPFPLDPKPEKVETVAKVASARRHALGQSFRGDITFEIWHQSTPERKALNQALRQRLGMAPDQAFPFSPEGSSCTFHLREPALGDLGAPLDVPSGWNTPNIQVIEAIKKRCREVADQVLPASHPTIALVQIAPPKSFDSKTDPKDALRRAFACTGRLSQFINTNLQADDALLEFPARSAVLDALRQLGLQLPLPQRLKATQPVAHAVGLWILKSPKASNGTGVEENIPVMVRVDGATGEVMAIAGLMERWRPYRDVLLLIGSGEVRGVKYFNQIPARIHTLLRRDLLCDQDVLLLAHAQNARLAWPWLQNSKLARDTVDFGAEGTLGQPVEEWRGLRVARVRENGGSHETPEYYPENHEGAPGFPQGLFGMGERVFMSLNPKPKTVQIDKRRSILEAWTSKGGSVRDPSIDEYDHNNALCEITMACIQPGDDPRVWADFAHRLRLASTHHDGGTALPLPLHLAKKMGEYVLPLEDEE